jgi:hypothetical protein
LLSNGDSAASALDECIKVDNEFLRFFRLSPTRLLRMLSGVLPVIDSKGMLSFLEKHFRGPDGKLLTVRGC